LLGDVGEFAVGYGGDGKSVCRWRWLRDGWLRPNDPVALIGGVVALLLVAAVAVYLPVRRASQIDPMISLRYE